MHCASDDGVFFFGEVSVGAGGVDGQDHFAESLEAVINSIDS